MFAALRLLPPSVYYGAALPSSPRPCLHPFCNPQSQALRITTGYGTWVGLVPSWLASRKALPPSPASNKMLEVHRCRQIEWSPSPVVALATSVNGIAVAAARENGGIEIWSVAAGSVGWHCQLSIPGRRDAHITSLMWCKARGDDDSPLGQLGRLFSAGLDGFVTEWDLHTLQPKAMVESMGGSVWQLAAEHINDTPQGSNGTSKSASRADDGSDEEDEGSSSSDSDHDDEPVNGDQRVALACEDGCVRIFEVGNANEGMVYRQSLPLVKGRILSVAWSWDGSRLVAGGSDGCIRCWDISCNREIYRITASIGVKQTADLCIWSLLILRDGDIVSGDSSGSTQFWDGQLGTLLQSHTHHKADVLALAASPSHRSIFAAGADGQVILFQRKDPSKRIMEDASMLESLDIAQGALTEKWIYLGGKRTHSHDVRSLAVACPIVSAVISGQRKKRKWQKGKVSTPSDYRKWAKEQTAMLISGGNDTKLFTYPANGFLSFYPHDVCPAPERPYIQLAHQSASEGGSMMMAQHSTRVDIWKIFTQDSADFHSGNGNLHGNGHSVLGKRKWDGGSEDEAQPGKVMSNGHDFVGAPLKGANGIMLPRPWRSGHSLVQDNQQSLGQNLGRSQGMPPALMARIKCKSAEHISSSSISGNGRLVAFSDCHRPRLYELEQPVEKVDGTERKMFNIKRRKLPAVLQAVHCMVFSVDSTHLLLAGSQGIIWVVDTESTEVVHTFDISSHDKGSALSNALVRIMCTSPDGQWLAAATSSAHIIVYNMEILRHQWTVPVLDGTPATAMVFHPGGNNVLIVSSAANQIHALDVEMKAPGEWSKRYGAQLAKKLLDFPGGIIGLSLPPSPKSTSIIAYSPSAMCHIDFTKPIGDEVEDVGGGVTGNEVHCNGNVRLRANGNGKIDDMSISPRNSSRNSNSFVVVPMKHPVLFLGHTGHSSALLVEKPWLEVLQQLPAPVFRHIYGT